MLEYIILLKKYISYKILVDSLKFVQCLKTVFETTGNDCYTLNIPDALECINGLVDLVEDIINKKKFEF